MARDRNTYAKQAREVEKRRKAEAKRAARRKKAQAPEPVAAGSSHGDGAETDSDLVVGEE